jgi:1,2-diacylglycerol 3-beta-glucosyltransferase
MQPGTPKKTDKKEVSILVVEDVANVAAVLEARLEFFGYSVCAIANSGPQAVASALQLRPDLILMDILLTGEMNGIQAAEQISGAMDVPIIFLSCVNDQHLLDQALKITPYGFILKPYDSAELNFSIRNALSRHQEDLKRKVRILELEKRCSEC